MANTRSSLPFTKVKWLDGSATDTQGFLESLGGQFFLENIGEARILGQRRSLFKASKLSDYAPKQLALLLELVVSKGEPCTPNQFHHGMLFYPEDNQRMEHCESSVWNHCNSNFGSKTKQLGKDNGTQKL